jgi:hypothetical protein
MVLKVATHREVLADLDPEELEILSRADARDHQQHRRLVAPGGEDHVALGSDLIHLAAPRGLDAHCTRAVEDDAQRHCVGDHIEVRTLESRVQEGRGRRATPPVALCELKTPHALLDSAVEVRVELVAREPARLDHRLDHRAHGAAVGHAQRPADAVERVLAALVVLRALEVRKDVLVAPAFGAAGRPLVVVGSVAADVDHRVDGAGAADDLAARHREPTIAEAGFRVAVEIPVDGRLEQHREGHRHRDLRPAVPATGLEHRDLDVGILAETRRKHASRRARADDHVVVHPNLLNIR